LHRDGRKSRIGIFRQVNMTDSISSSGSPEEVSTFPEKRVWHRSTLFNAFIIGGVGFLAPGLWNAMNSLGAGGAESPYLINAANALVFGLSRSLTAV
jgi:hypothetical protein